MPAPVSIDWTAAAHLADCYDRDRIACPECGEHLSLSQPDAADGHALVASCDACHGQYLAELDDASGVAVLIDVFRAVLFHRLRIALESDRSEEPRHVPAPHVLHRPPPMAASASRGGLSADT